MGSEVLGAGGSGFKVQGSGFRGQKRDKRDKKMVSVFACQVSENKAQRTEHGWQGNRVVAERFRN